MLVAKSSTTKTQVSAAGAKRADGPFLCPECGDRVSLRQGSSNTPHFAHTPSGRCSFGNGETEDHRRCKQEIFEALRKIPNVVDVELERRMDGVRPDVYAVINRVPVAIEVQISTLSPAAISRRTAAYLRLGVHVLWLLQWTPVLNRPDYSPRRFERWLHATYYGRVYFWLAGLTVLPYRFEGTEITVEKYRWLDNWGKTHSAGGYSRPSKRFKRALRGKPLDISRDFRGVSRSAWLGPNLAVPAANLFLDTRKEFLRNDDRFAL